MTATLGSKPRDSKVPAQREDDDERYNDDTLAGALDGFTFRQGFDANQDARCGLVN